MEIVTYPSGEMNVSNGRDMIKREGILTVIVAVVVESLVCRRERNAEVCCKVLRATALRLSEWRPQTCASPDLEEYSATVY